MQWDGEVAFGDTWCAFRGASADNRRHAHAAVQLVAGEAITLEDGSGFRFTGPGWAVRSGVRHRLRPTPMLTMLLLDPQSHLAAALQALLPPAAEAPIAALPPALVRQLLQPVPVAVLVQAWQRPEAGTGERIDRRLAAALEQLAQPAAGQGVAAAAAAAGLSPSRLRALSQAQCGLPLSRLVLWAKVRRAGQAIVRGATLTEAALEAGFADQSHLTRTMRGMIGLTPGEARTATR